ncbi:MAG TPA: dual specificity protein phosphatase family protein [Rudaea sp.]|nr:dual specificity protein phosphatase family protein [Rudaea sp.]
MTLDPRFDIKRLTQLTAATAVLFALTAASPRAAAGSPIAIDNFARVDANYYRGSQPSGRDYNDLASLGVKTVVDLTGDDGQVDETRLVSAAGMKYFHIPMTTHVAPTKIQVDQFLAIVNDARNQPVYVHCVGGSHRTGVMTAVYRMINDHWAADRAFAEMKTFKFGPDFLHSEFKKFVLGFRLDPSLTASARTASTKAGS